MLNTTIGQVDRNVRHEEDERHHAALGPNAILREESTVRPRLMSQLENQPPERLPTPAAA